MLIFKSNDDKYYVFIHIPKNSGKYIRNKIADDKNNKILQSYWDINSLLDLAHIPYIKRNEFIKNNIEHLITEFKTKNKRNSISRKL